MFSANLHSDSLNAELPSQAHLPAHPRCVGKQAASEAPGGDLPPPAVANLGCEALTAP